MPIPVHRREYNAFLSHAHADHDLAQELHRFLTKAGLAIWYDARQMDGGDSIASGLQSAIEKCRGVLLLASAESIKRGWVKTEIEIARAEHGDSPEFRIVVLRIGTADVDSVARGLSRIDVPEGKLDTLSGARLLRSFYPGEYRPDPRLSRDVYFSGSWRPADNASALAVARALAGSGLRLIGDARDQKGFRSDRVREIIESCGAFVGVIPLRDNNKSASRGEKATYENFLKEIDLATQMNLPTLVIADPSVRRIDGDDSRWLRLETTATELSPAVKSAVEQVWEDWSEPRHPHYIFFACDLDSRCALPESDLRQLIERITGMATYVGKDVSEQDLQAGIMNKIKEAFLVIADISGAAEGAWNVDVCIEAGMALAGSASVSLMMRNKARTPPFMLRSCGQVLDYADEVDQLAAVHRIVREYRRRVINTELG